MRQHSSMDIFTLGVVETFLLDRAVQRGTKLPREGLWFLSLKSFSRRLGGHLMEKLERDFGNPVGG